MSATLKIDGTDYPLPIEEVLGNLTGTESLMLEDFLGGWDRFDIQGATTRSIIVLVWLAKHHAGEDVDLDEVMEMRGLVFGDAVEIKEQEDDARPPDESASESSPETSATNGAPAYSETSTA